MKLTWMFDTEVARRRSMAMRIARGSFGDFFEHLRDVTYPVTLVVRSVADITRMRDIYRLYGNHIKIFSVFQEADIKFDIPRLMDNGVLISDHVGLTRPLITDCFLHEIPIVVLRTHDFSEVTMEVLRTVSDVVALDEMAEFDYFHTFKNRTIPKDGES